MRFNTFCEIDEKIYKRGRKFMKSTRRVIWGIVLIIVGAVFALNVLGITDFNIFFDGWWTLFIIIPSLVGLFTDRDKSSSVFWLVIGVLLLLWRRDVLDIGLAFKLLIPAVIIIIGLKLIFGNKYHAEFKRIKGETQLGGKKQREICATFSGQNVDLSGEIFDGAELTAVFGGIKLDLSMAVVEKDCTIEANAIFGGVEIKMPANVNVKIGGNAFFGGTSNKIDHAEIVGAPTVYINATGVFGGVTVL